MFADFKNSFTIGFSKKFAIKHVSSGEVETLHISYYIANSLLNPIVKKF